MRPAKTLTAHIASHSFRGARHGHLLAKEDLHLASPADSPACPDLANLRASQDDYRRSASPEIRRDIPRAFAILVREYVEARDHALPDPEVVIPGLGPNAAPVKGSQQTHSAARFCADLNAPAERLRRRRNF